MKSVQNVLALALCFGVAGLSSSACQLVKSRLSNFGLLSAGPSRATLLAVPVLMLSTRFLIMRNMLLARRQEGRSLEFVVLATLIAGFWSLMSGLVLVMTLQACGFLHD